MTKISSKTTKEQGAGLTAEEAKLRAEQRKRAARKKRKKLVKTLAVLLVIALVIGFAVWKFFDLKRREVAASNLTTYTVTRRTITEKLSATGTLKPADSYTITSKVKGDILEAYFEEGDEVQKDQVLYVIDSGDMDSTIRQRRMSLDKAEKNLSELQEQRKELSAKSDLSGTVQKLYVEVGDTVQKGGAVADIVDNENMLIDLPFHAIHADSMEIGTVITVIVEGNGERLSGTVKKKATITGINEFGAPTREVTVLVKNPGGISKNTRASAEYSGDITSTDSANFYYNIEEKLTAQYGGEILTLNINEGGKVTDGQVIMTFDSEDLEDRIKDAEDSLETAQMNYDDTLDNLSDYEITAPIAGTVVEKNYNVGESIDITGGNATVAIIYDLSALTFDMNIDEIDIFSIQKGQEVTITSEARDGEVFFGEITKISKVGTTLNGVTTYPVTVTITDENALSSLLPGMNIDAEIIVNRSENVLAIPTGAVARGNTVKVVKNPDALKEDDKTSNTDKSTSTNSGTTSENMPQTQNRPSSDSSDRPAMNIPQGGFPEGSTFGDGGTKPEGNPFGNGETESENNSFGSGMTMPENMPSKEGISGTSGRGEMQMPAVYGTAPAETEYETVRVTVGISDDDFVEIVSGLSEGDIVIVEQNRNTSSSAMGMMGMGGMPSGGMMGMGGGMPSGGMSGRGQSGGMPGIR
ncbi:MAG: HlyD family efflux transporter periplasmic adaptor subunit [Clostridia bacterium]|nr:HlyD family efflux transporter periplasmic adaptor subunit [Clostridia bacterium]